MQRLQGDEGPAAALAGAWRVWGEDGTGEGWRLKTDEGRLAKARRLKGR